MSTKDFREMKSLISDAVILMTHGNEQDSRIDHVKEILDKIPSHQADTVHTTVSSLGQTALLHAIEAQRPDLASYMLCRFPCDLNDPKVAKPKSPLSASCAKGNVEVTTILLDAGARLTGKTGKAASDPKEDKSPAYHAIRSDSSGCLSLLIKYGLLDIYRVNVLLKLALDMHAPCCTELLAPLFSQEPVVPIVEKNELLMQASGRGIRFVKALLRVGIVYDDDLLNDNKDILLLYYSNVGLHKRNFESSCASFTSLILEGCDGKKILADAVNTKLVSVLLLRMSKNTRRFISMSKEDIEEHYNDIQCAMEALLRHSPTLLGAMTSAQTHTVLNAALLKTKTTRCAKHEIIFALNLIRFLMERRWSITQQQCSKLLNTSNPMCYHVEPCEVNVKLGIMKSEILEVYTSKAADEDRNAIVNSIFHSSEGMAENTSAFLAFISRAIPILHRRSITWAREVGECDTTRQTRFQSIVVHFCKSINKRNQNLSRPAALLSTIVLLARTCVNFDIEVEQHDAFLVMCGKLGDLVGMEETFPPISSRHTSKGYLEEHTTPPVTTSALLTIKFIMLHLEHSERINMLQRVCQCYQDRVRKADTKAYIEKVIRSELYPLIYHMSLRNMCFSAIRIILTTSAPLGVIRPSKDRFSSMEHIENPSRDMDVLDRMVMYGIYVDFMPELEHKVEMLPLPVSLKRLLIFKHEMLDIFNTMWSYV